MADAGSATAHDDDACYVGDFRFDRVTHRLWHDDAEVPLRPKAAAVLEILVDHAGDLVLKQELLDAVWSDGYVGDAVLSVCVNELRHALHDDAHDARFIATVHRRGYRLVADVSSGPQAVARPRLFVGRTDELAMLHRWWQHVLDGERRVGFVAAQAGTGKTALVDTFVDELRRRATVPLVGRGQCVELVGSGEPYLPVLQAMENLWRGPRSAAIAEILRRTAASWLVQLPGLFTDAQLITLRRRVGRPSSPRLLREFAVALEQVSALRPVVLVFEDLHHADRSTVELISYLAHRREPAHLLILGTYRPAEVIATTHPLRATVQDLRAHGSAGHLSLELLSATEVGAYLAARLAPRQPTDRLMASVQERTEGNALFLVALCDHLLRDGLLVEAGPDGLVDTTERLVELGIPSEVRLMLEHQVDSLDQMDRRMLEAAAAVGVVFAADTVHSALAGEQDEIGLLELEERCSRLARIESLVREDGALEWPDGTTSARYRFTHEMYREILYERLGPTRRALMHEAIGAHLVARSGPSAAQVAAELAVHFERGRDYASAIRWAAVAAETAVARSAYPEAHGHVERGLALLSRVEDGHLRDRLELALRRTQVVGGAAIWGWRDPETLHACERLEQLATTQRDTRSLVTALLGLHNAAMMEDDEPGMRNCLTRIDAVTPTGDAAAQLVADLLHIRDDSRDGRCDAMWERAQRMLDLCARAEHADLGAVVGEELDVSAHLYGGLALWQLGCADQARAHASAALTRARGHGVPAGLARTTWFAAMIHLLCREAPRVRELAAELHDLCARHDLPIWAAGATVLEGWAVGALGDGPAGLELIREGAQRWSNLAGIGDPLHRRLAAELHLSVGDVAGGLAATASGLDAVTRTRSVQSEPELWRLRGELLLLDGPEHEGEAETAMTRALALTTTRGIRGLGLRAATSLARLRRAQGRGEDARELLASTYTTFTEGHDTRDLIDAAAVLESLGPRTPPDHRR